MKEFLIEIHNIANRCCRSGKCAVCRRVRTSFSPEVLQAGAVKGLKPEKYSTASARRSQFLVSCDDMSFPDGKY